MSATNDEIIIEVAYALPSEQLIIPIKTQEGISAEDAIIDSGILQKFPEIDLSKNAIGIFGKLAKKTTTLRHMDRVEIYRPLIADPKEVRRKRAADGKKMKKGGGDLEAE